MTTRITRGAALLLAVLVAAVLGVDVATAHGYTDNPASRARWCQKGEVRQCGDVQYEPQSTEGEGDFPAHGPADGQLCSAGHQRFGEIDKPRAPDGAKWPATTVHSDEPVTLSWTITASHVTTDFRWYLTKPGWDQSRALTRADLDLDHPIIVGYDGKKPPKYVEFPVNGLPDRTGRHVMLGVWGIKDTAPPHYTAFYSCADVYFP